MSDNITDEYVKEYWEEEYKKCQDPVYFYSNYLRIKGPDGNMEVPPPLTDKEKAFMRYKVR